jgi:hypothetical protein
MCNGTWFLRGAVVIRDDCDRVGVLESPVVLLRSSFWLKLAMQCFCGVVAWVGLSAMTHIWGGMPGTWDPVQLYVWRDLSQNGYGNIYIYILYIYIYIHMYIYIYIYIRTQ